MDFFEAQARARKRTSRLVALFGLAVAGTIGAGYISAVLIFRQVAPRAQEVERGYEQYQRTADWPSGRLTSTWWDPQLLGLVSLGTIAVVGLASLYQWSRFSSGGSAVAESVGGQQVDPQTTNPAERQLLNVVEEMAIAAGTPVPAVYLLRDEPAINAFAAGLTTNDAVIAVTRGALEKLSRDELQGVIGHEFSHILNGDMRLNLRIAAIVFGILVIGLLGRGVLGSLRVPRARGRRGNSGGIIIVVGVALMLIGYVGYFFGRLIQAAVSRQREFLADASAVQFTRNPVGLTGALKKIGGYALGSTIQSSKSAAIGHFFFAQAFRSGFTGWWSTHPPLDERLRAIDPQFDGRMFAPPQVVDIARESFRTAGFTAGTRVSPSEAARLAFAAEPDIPASPPPRPKIPYRPAAVVAAIGTLTPALLAGAQVTLDSIPDGLRTAAHSSDRATTLVYGLLLGDDPSLRAGQLEQIATRAGSDAFRHVQALEPDLRRVTPAQKLPLLQIALPALRQLPAAALATFLDTLDELVHADAQVSPFEFALQKLLVHSLELGRHPRAARTLHHSLDAVGRELAVVLSVLARTATGEPAAAEKAFQAGVSHFVPAGVELTYVAEPASDIAALDAALDILMAASFPIKQRLLLAAANVVGTDGEVRVEEAELVRAISAALDCPMPPLATAS